MTKRIVVMALAALLAVALCTPALAGGKADAKGLWTLITKKSPYTKWAFFPDHKGMQPGRAPHGPLHKVYVNKAGLKAKKAPYPYGAIVVKENFNKARKLVAITVMYKVKGYNPSAGDWFWVMYKPDGMVGKAGKPKGCVRCHGAVAKKDWVFVHNFK